MCVAAASSHRCSVLLVEDDSDVREMMKLALAGEGYSVAAVSNGWEALHHLRSTPNTCLIVLDLILPDMDGERFRAAQMRDRSLAWIPVVLISGALGAQQKARELKAHAFVPKPLDIDQLRAAIRRVGCGCVTARATRSIDRERGTSINSSNSRA